MERDRETLIREVKEELSVDIKKQTIKKLGQFEAQAHGEPLGVKVIMHCYLAEYDGDLKEGSEVEEISWLSYEDVNSEKTSPVDKLVLSYLRDEGMID
jgi:8-oxo-dGTP pyrophosphatase MutT (NUDIX family)